MSKWISMTWKRKDSVFVNKKSWKSQSTLVEYKYDVTHSKTYKGSRSNFSSPKKTKSKKKSTSKSTSKSKKKSTKKHSNNSSLPISPTNTQQNQKINDFLMIAATCNAKIASNLLRNSNWNVQNALEFYFKHKTQIDNAQNQQISHSSKTKITPREHKTHTKQIQSKISKPATIKFGKAGTRTEKQKKLVKENFDELFASFGDNEIICFTDGACKGNPGPAGSGCLVLYGKKNKDRFIQKSMALGNQTNNIAELYAIGMSIHIIKQHPSSNKWIKMLNGDTKLFIRILSDSKYSIGVLSKNWKPKKNKELIGWIKRDLDLLCQMNVIVSFHWVGGHSGIKYNEIADTLANQGVEGCIGNKIVDVRKAINLYGNISSGLGMNDCERSNSNSKPLKRKRKMKRKYNDIEEVKNNESNDGRIKRRKLNNYSETNSKVIENTNNKMSVSPPQSPFIS